MGSHLPSPHLETPSNNPTETLRGGNAEGRAFLMTSTNKGKLSKGQRESRTRKEAEAEGSGGRAEEPVTGAKLKLLGLPAEWGEKGSGRELPQTLGTVSSAVGQGSP